MLRAKRILHLVSMPHREQLFSKFIFFADTNLFLNDTSVEKWVTWGWFSDRLISILSLYIQHQNLSF